MQGLRKTARRLMCAALLALLMAALLPTAAMAAKAEASATTMRVAGTEGTVTVKNASGQNKSLFNNMQLYNGWTVETAAASYATLSLDSAKAIKLGAGAKVELRQNTASKRLELFVTKGSLFFDVSEELPADQTMNIRTSNMVCGIRGTMGEVKAVSPTCTVTYLLDGETAVINTNDLFSPLTGVGTVGASGTAAGTVTATGFFSNLKTALGAAAGTSGVTAPATDPTSMLTVPNHGDRAAVYIYEGNYIVVPFPGAANETNAMGTPALHPVRPGDRLELGARPAAFSVKRVMPYAQLGKVQPGDISGAAQEYLAERPASLDRAVQGLEQNGSGDVAAYLQELTPETAGAVKAQEEQQAAANDADSATKNGDYQARQANKVEQERGAVGAKVDTWGDTSGSGNMTITDDSGSAVNLGHDITIEADPTYGRVTADKSRAVQNETVTLTVSPAEGFGLYAISAKRADGAAVKLTVGADGTRSFTMPGQAVKVTATFRPIMPEPTFTYASDVVTIGSTVEGAQLCYTSDGRVPATSSDLSPTSKKDVTAPQNVTVGENATVKAFAYMDGYIPSGVATYTVGSGAPAPTQVSAVLRAAGLNDAVSGLSLAVRYGSEGSYSTYGPNTLDKTTVWTVPLPVGLTAFQLVPSSPLPPGYIVITTVQLCYAEADSDEIKSSPATGSVADGVITFRLPELPQGAMPQSISVVCKVEEGSPVSYALRVDDSLDSAEGSIRFTVDGQTVTTAAPGKTVTLVASPAEGYTAVSAVCVKGSGESVPLTSGGDGTWTFTMPAENVTATASFVQQGSPITVKVASFQYQKNNTTMPLSLMTVNPSETVSTEDLVLTYDTGTMAFTLSPAEGISKDLVFDSNFTLGTYNSAGYFGNKSVAEDGGSVSFTFTPTYEIGFETFRETEGDSRGLSGVEVTLTLPDGTTETQTTEGSETLATAHFVRGSNQTPYTAGEYSYVLKKDGYADVEGSFTLTEADNLGSKKWVSVTMEEPQAYTITPPSTLSNGATLSIQVNDAAAVSGTAEAYAGDTVTLVYTVENEQSWPDNLGVASRGASDGKLLNPEERGISSETIQGGYRITMTASYVMPAQNVTVSEAPFYTITYSSELEGSEMTSTAASVIDNDSKTWYYAPEGETVTVYVTGNESSQGEYANCPASVKVNDGSVATTLTERSDVGNTLSATPTTRVRSTYTFQMPAEDAGVTATFEAASFVSITALHIDQLSVTGTCSGDATHDAWTLTCTDDQPEEGCSSVLFIMCPEEELRFQIDADSETDIAVYKGDFETPLEASEGYYSIGAGSKLFVYRLFPLTVSAHSSYTLSVMPYLDGLETEVTGTNIDVPEWAKVIIATDAGFQCTYYDENGVLTYATISTDQQENTFFTMPSYAAQLTVAPVLTVPKSENGMVTVTVNGTEQTGTDYSEVKTYIIVPNSDVVLTATGAADYWPTSFTLEPSVNLMLTGRTCNSDGQAVAVYTFNMPETNTMAETAFDPAVDFYLSISPNNYHNEAPKFQVSYGEDSEAFTVETTYKEGLYYAVVPSYTGQVVYFKPIPPVDNAEFTVLINDVALTPIDSGDMEGWYSAETPGSDPVYVDAVCSVQRTLTVVTVGNVEFTLTDPSNNDATWELDGDGKITLYDHAAIEVHASNAQWTCTYFNEKGQEETVEPWTIDLVPTDRFSMPEYDATLTITAP